ncbi:MAG: phosphodiesterase [Gammaproteobacteria bacterium]|nr:phosphodiesterase [Gammaproteobacteria bacterium]
MLIAHISDSHIAGWKKKAYGVAPTAENLLLCVGHINRLVPQPDVVLITGDITYTGLLEEAECAAAILEKLQYPYYLVPGNHDDRSTLWSVFGKGACPGKSEAFLNYVVDDYDIRLIGMDSSIDTAPGGEICEMRANWLAHQLSVDSDRPSIIFMHHPPAKCGVLETDEDGFIGADRLGSIVAGFDNVEAILCGHIHIAAHLRWHGTVITTAQGMGMQLALDLTLTKPSQFSLELPGYQLHHFTSDRRLVSHTITVKSLDASPLFHW